MQMSAIMLAAGLSRRIGEQDKLLLNYKGKTIFQHAVELLDCLPCCEKILVTTENRLSCIDLPESVKPVINLNPEIGQSESLRLGLKFATGEQYLFLNADQPRLNITNLSPLLELARHDADKIIYPTIEGMPCTPIIFPSRFRNDLLKQTGDAGGRAIRTSYPQFCLGLAVDNPFDFMDVDCLEDYEALCSL